jgi:putative hydrolase of the HAD superfamily
LKSPAHIRAVTFDVGGTLIEPWPSVGHIYAEVAAQYGWKGIDPARLNRRFAAAWRQLRDFRHTRRQWAALVEAAFAGAIPPGTSRSFFNLLYKRFAQPDAWRIIDDVVPALNSLAERGLKLGVISNWDDRLLPLLDRLKLRPHFQVIVVSCRVRCIKPDQRIFFRTARRLGLSPSEILHVGDSFEADVQGARRAGFRSVLLRRGQAPGKRAINSLLEVPTMLAGA